MHLMGRGHIRVFANETAEAHLAAISSNRSNQSREAEIAQGIRTGFGSDLFHREVRRDELPIGRHVDAEIAGVLDRRRGDS